MMIETADGALVTPDEIEAFVLAVLERIDAMTPATTTANASN